MCMEHKLVCSCGKNNASFTFVNSVMPPEVIDGLYCPECGKEIELEEAKMLNDNGWVISYNMDIAALYSKRLPAQDASELSPEILFDKGYATWRGIYPGEHIDAETERNEIAKLAKEDPKEYFKKIKTWAIDRMERIKEEGWRKANE